MYAILQGIVDAAVHVLWRLFCELKVDERTVSLVLWDTAGQEDYDRLRPVCYQHCNVVIVCFAVDSRNSYNNVIDKWMPEVRHFCPNTPVVLVATKTDLRLKPHADDKQQLTTNDGDELARRLSADAYVECSSKTGDRVAGVFQIAAREALRAGRQSKPNFGRRRKCNLL